MVKESANTELTLRRIRAFVKTVEKGTHQEAGKALGNLTRQTISKAISDLEQDTFQGRKLLEPDLDTERNDGISRRLKLTPFGKLVHLQAEKVLREVDQLASVDLHSRPHVTIGYLPHHGEFIAQLLTPKASKRHSLDISAQVLEERHRSTRVFQEEVIRNLDTGDFDIVIGPRPASDTGLELRMLYTAQYVALVPKALGLRKLDAAKALELKLLLPPSTTRAGKNIRDSLNAAAIASAGAETISDAEEVWRPNVVAESHGTKVLVIQAVAYNSALDGSAAGAAVIVPGDIAFVFSRHGTLSGGEQLEESCEWVPFVAPAGPEFMHDVFATCRKLRNTDTDRVLDQIEKAARSRLKSKLFVTFPKKP